MKIRENPALCFDDVLLAPKFFPGKSRRDIDISTTLAGLNLHTPFICANMSFCEKEVCAELADKCLGLGVFHRNNTPQQQTEIIKSFLRNNIYCNRPNWEFGVAVGLTDWRERLSFLKNDKKQDLFDVCLVVLDVAHADQQQYWTTAEAIRKEYPEVSLCLGSFGTKPSPENWEKWKNDPYACFRTSVGGGSACSTRIATGCGVPTLQSILEFDGDLPVGGLIADGGIKSGGDVVKSLAAGASACMMGRIFAGCDEGAGGKIKDDRTGKSYKVYAGNASVMGKTSAGLDPEYIEGVSTLVECSGPIETIVRRLEQGVRSGMSYCGAMNIKKLQENAEFVMISNAGMRESVPHVLN